MDDRLTQTSPAFVWFVFTDIEGSTTRWERFPEAMPAALAAHDRILTASITQHDGRVFKHTGDGMVAAFSSAARAIDATVAAQLALAAESFDAVEGLPVRMGIDGGPAHARDGDYFGPTLNRAARIMDMGNGGQVVVSDEARSAAATSTREVEFRELGLHRVKGISRPMRVHQVCYPSMPDITRPMRSMNSSAGNIPSSSRELYGRAGELDQIDRFLDEPRLITLVGPGGVGKTTLAQEAARRALARFPDGAWFCDLSAVRDEDAVPEALARVLGIDRRSGQTIVETLRDALSPRNALLLLDNCEHLTSACAALVAAILTGHTNVRFLATSRQPISTPTELCLRVRPLAVSDDGDPSGDEAFALFLDRAESSGRRVVRSAANDAAVRRICAQVDGLPLAIELAAARTSVLAVTELAARLDQRMRLLRRSAGDDRHRTLEATLDWSHGLLEQPEKDVFAALGAFEGGFDLEAVANVATLDEFDALDLIASLQAKSMVEVSDVEGSSRYRLLETVREYAVGRLAARDDRDDVQRSHAEHFAGLVRRARVELHGDDERVWLVRLRHELANLRLSFHYWIEHDPPTAALIPVSLWPFWTSQLLSDEAIRWLTQARDALDPNDPLCAQVVDDLASMEWSRGDNRQAEQSCLDAIEQAQANGVEPRPTVLVRLASIWAMAGRPSDAVPICEQALTLVRAGYEPSDKVEILPAIGAVLAICGKGPLAAELCDEGIESAQQRGPSAYASALQNAATAFAFIDPPKAVELATKSLAMAESIGSPYGNGNALFALGLAELFCGRPSESRRAFAGCLPRLRDSGMRNNLLTAMEALGTQLGPGAAEGAVVLAGACSRMRAELSSAGSRLQQSAARAQYQRLRGLLSDEAFDVAFDRGLSLSLDEAVDEALHIVDEVEAFGAFEDGAVLDVRGIATS